MFPERRRKRSSYATLSLHYWFNAVVRRKNIFAMVLADSAGLLVASSFKGPEAEELAAVAPLLARGTEPPPIDRSSVPMIIRRMSLDRSSLYLCAVGERERSQDGLRLAEDGVRRILTTH